MSLQHFPVRSFRFALVLGSLAWTTGATAYPEFPAALRDSDELGPDGSGMTCTPTCSVCHATDPGQRGNATGDFADGLRMVSDFPGGGQPEDVEEALGLLPATADSDMDGMADKAELGHDPPTDPSNANSYAVDMNGMPVQANGRVVGGNACSAEIKYGCGAHIASAPQKSVRTWGWALLAAALGLSWLARRRQTVAR